MNYKELIGGKGWKTPNSYSGNHEYPKEKPGVYVIMAYSKNLTVSKIIYIGSTSNLCARYRSHNILQNANCYVKFYFFVCRDYAWREKKLIKQFKPPLNKQFKNR